MGFPSCQPKPITVADACQKLGSLPHGKTGWKGGGTLPFGFSVYLGLPAPLGLNLLLLF